MANDFKVFFVAATGAMMLIAFTALNPPPMTTSYESVPIVEKDKEAEQTGISSGGFVNIYTSYKYRLYFQLDKSLHSAEVDKEQYLATNKGDLFCLEKKTLENGSVAVANFVSDDRCQVASN